MAALSVGSSKRIIFWQSTPSSHQAAYIRALAEPPLMRTVKLFLSYEHDKQRSAMGLHDPDYGHVPVAFKPDEAEVAKNLLSSDGNTVQLFSEFIADSSIRGILQRTCLGPGMVGLISEGRDWRGYKGFLRLLHGYTCERRLARRVDFILAIGQLATEWYARCGFPRDKIFDFCYVAEKTVTSERPIRPQNDPMRLLFVGQLIRRKRLDLLLQALSTLASSSWVLRVIGDGPEFQSLYHFSRQHGLSDRVQLLGGLDNSLVRHELANSDILVLPSDWDGWGAVVNEALMSGTRVVCSNFCGAADLIKGKGCGDVFQAGSTASLAASLEGQFAQGPVGSVERQAIIRYGETFNGPTVARYLNEIIEFVAGGKIGVRPVPPWALPSLIARP